MSERPAADAEDIVVVALGSNQESVLGPPRAILEAAIDALKAKEFMVLAASRWWRSAAWPDPSDPEYVNAVITGQYPHGPEKLHRHLLQIEADFGRVRAARNAPRPLDLDLIAFGRAVSEGPDLILPHPRASERAFVMGPLAEIMPGWRHPASGRSAAELYREARVGCDARPL